MVLRVYTIGGSGTAAPGNQAGIDFNPTVGQQYVVYLNPLGASDDRTPWMILRLTPRYPPAGLAYVERVIAYGEQIVIDGGKWASLGLYYPNLPAFSAAFNGTSAHTTAFAWQLAQTEVGSLANYNQATAIIEEIDVPRPDVLRPHIFAGRITGGTASVASAVTKTEKWLVPAGQRWRIRSVSGYLNATTTTGAEVAVQIVRKTASVSGAAIYSPNLFETMIRTVAAAYYGTSDPTGSFGSTNVIVAPMPPEGIVLFPGDFLKIYYSVQIGDTWEADVFLSVESDT